MKLAIIGHQYRLPKHWKLGRELARLGVDVMMLTPESWQGERVGSIPVNENKWMLLPAQTDMSGDIFNYTMRAWELLKEYKPDWIFSDSEPCAVQTLASLRWAKRLGCKMACYSWENVFKDYGSRSRVEKKILTNCDIAIVGNEGARRNLTLKGCDPAKTRKILETGIDTELYKPVPNVEKKYDCLFVGRRVPEKGVHLIDATFQDPEFRRNFREEKPKLLWVGKGAYSPLEGEVKGYMPEEELPSIYNSARIFLYPCIPTSDWQEQGFYSGLEALACGVYVISTFCGAIPELVEGCNMVQLVQPNDVRALRDHLLRVMFVLRYPTADYSQVQTQASQFVSERYSLPVIAKKYLQVFEKS
jgi:glycosyltransferase involved in cell wall biosynthesis